MTTPAKSPAELEIRLSPQLSEMIEEKIRAGQYTTPGEVVSDALRIVQEQEAVTAQDVEELRAEIAVGLAQLERGEGAAWNVEEVKADVRRMLTHRPERKK